VNFDQQFIFTFAIASLQIASFYIVEWLLPFRIQFEDPPDAS
jgi:hypothetical protein